MKDVIWRKARNFIVELVEEEVNAFSDRRKSEEITKVNNHASHWNGY